jgi:hypothetical protein
MSRVLRVYNSDHKIAVQDGGTITLDTGDLVGTTVVTGNLEVKGTTTTVDSTEVTIADNILVLSSGTVGNSLPASVDYISGIEIDRGTGPKVEWIYDENISWELGGQSGTGTFYAIRGRGTGGSTKLPIHTTGIVSPTTLYVDTGAGTISVTNSAGDYEERIWSYSGGVITPDGTGNIIIDDDNIPNAKAVKDYIDYIFGNELYSAIAQGNTTVEVIDEQHVIGSITEIDSGGAYTTITVNGQHGFTVADTVDISGVSSSGDPLENLNGTGIAITAIISANTFRVAVDTTGGTLSNYVPNSGSISKSGFVESRAKIDIEGINVANFYNNRFEVEGLKIQDTEISTTASNQDLVLSSPGTGSIKIKDILELTPTLHDGDPASEPLAPIEGTKIYTLSQPGTDTTGNTGIYYVNSNDKRDELIAKNRSLLFSMLF